MTPLTFNGITILPNANMTEHGEPINIRRTWKQRLFSWPWKPWCNIMTVTPYTPSKKVYMLKSQGIAFAHPAVIDELRRQIHDKGLSQAQDRCEPKRDC